MKPIQRLVRNALIGALATTGLLQASFAQTKVIGYIGAWSGLQTAVNAVDLSKITHLQIAFANPAPGGSFLNGGSPACMSNATAADVNYLVNKAHTANVKVLVSVAGGVIPACSGDWATLVNPTNRASTVSNIVQFVNTFALDGVDVDLENDLLTSIDNAGNYTPFVQALRAALPGKLVTAATASYAGAMLPASAIPYLDWVGLMSYDAVGPGWGTAGGEHSPYSQATNDIATWKARGLPVSKLIVGLPFYGYGFNGYAASYKFSDILSQFGTAAAQTDVVGTRSATTPYITYNGIPTIQSKTNLALVEGAGVMIWELAQDATGANSLLKAVNDVVQLSKTFTNKIEGESYSNMGGVQTENTTDTGGGSNVGWIDAGDWMAYANVNFPTSGTYKVEYRVASLNGGGQLSLDLNGGAIQLGSLTVPKTNGWQTWTTVTHNVTITAGTYSVGIYAPTGGWNINWLRFSKL